jgi:hypothetical protein
VTLLTSGRPLRHREERSDAAIQRLDLWIAALAMTVMMLPLSLSMQLHMNLICCGRP